MRTTRWDTMDPLPLSEEEQGTILERLEKLGLVQTSKEEGPTSNPSHAR